MRLDAAERRIDVRIPRPEPVAERRPQQLARRGRRRALHHEVLAVEEVGGVLRIRRHRAEAGKRRERACSSTPSRCRPDRRRPRRSRPAGWLPAGCGSQLEKSNTPCADVGRGVAPRIRAARRRRRCRTRRAGTRPRSAAARRATARTPTLRPGSRTPATTAAAECSSNMPRQYQRAVLRAPRTADARRARPAPTPSPPARHHRASRSRRPRRTRGTRRWSRRAARSRTPATSAAHARELVVPAERDRVRDRRRAWRGRREPRSIPARGDRAVDARRVAGRASLLLERQPMPHVEQRLLVHRLVLEDGEHRLGAIEQRIARADRGRRASSASMHPPIGFVGELLARVARSASASRVRRPGAGAAIRRGSMPRANSASSRGVDARRRRAPRLTSVLKLNAGQVALVEHDRMAQRDRLAVVRLVGEQIEQRARARAVAAIPSQHLVAVQGHPIIFTRKPPRCLQRKSLRE